MRNLSEPRLAVLTEPIPVGLSYGPGGLKLLIDGVQVPHVKQVQLMAWWGMAGRAEKVRA